MTTVDAVIVIPRNTDVSSEKLKESSKYSGRKLFIDVLVQSDHFRADICITFGDFFYEEIQES